MLREQKPALIFIAKYILLYVVMNSLYAFFVEQYKPNADPVTITVTKHSAFILSIFDNSVDYEVVRGKANVPIRKKSETVIEVFEGCNSINVIVVFIAFIVAFQGNRKLLLKFGLGGIALIYVINLLRIIGLYIVALEFPEALYFFHKFLFTGAIYLIVFGLWYWWTVKVKDLKADRV